MLGWEFLVFAKCHMWNTLMYMYLLLKLCFLKQTIDYGKNNKSRLDTTHCFPPHSNLLLRNLFTPWSSKMELLMFNKFHKTGQCTVASIATESELRNWKCQRFVNLFWLESIWTQKGFIMPRRNHCRLLKPQRVLQNVEYSLVHDRQHVTEQ